MSRKEVNTADMPIRQKPDVILSDVLDREPDVVVMTEEQLTKDYAEALAFNEEPIKILISPSAEKYAPAAHPVWCQGPGAEIFDAQLNKWVRYGCLPVGIPCITRRKYVEILAMSKIDTITTPEKRPGDNLEDDRVGRQTSSMAIFTVLEDRNPKGQEWLRRILYFN